VHRLRVQLYEVGGKNVSKVEDGTYEGGFFRRAVCTVFMSHSLYLLSYKLLLASRTKQTIHL